MMLEKIPTYKIHSKKGAAQFNLIPAYPSGRTFQSKGRTIHELSPGCVMVEVAEFLETKNGVKLYDWKRKVVMKLSPADLQELVRGLDRHEKITLEHFRKGNGNGKIKSFLNLFPGQQYGFTLQLCCQNLSPYVQITSDADAEVLKQLLLRGIVRSMGW